MKIFALLFGFIGFLCSAFTGAKDEFHVVAGVPIINGVSYAHADIVMNFLGAPVIGLTAINYSQVQTIEPNYSTGQLPTSVGFSTAQPQASITLTLEAWQAIIKIAPNGDVQNIPFFNIAVNYIPDNTNILVRHVFMSCRFKGLTISSQTGNTQIEVPCDLFVGKINFAG